MANRREDRKEWKMEGNMEIGRDGKREVRKCRMGNWSRGPGSTGRMKNEKRKVLK